MRGHFRVELIGARHDEAIRGVTDELDPDEVGRVGRSITEYDLLTLHLPDGGLAFIPTARINVFMFVREPLP